MRGFLQFNVLCALCCLCFVGCKEKAPVPEKSPVEEANRRTAFIQIAASQVGVMEDEPHENRGAKVDEYNLTCGKDFLGAPWCASFTRWCAWQAGQKNVPGAFSPDWYSKERKVSPEDVRAGDQALVYFSSLGRYAHTIACVESVGRREVTTIEGNSNPSGGRDGYGVFRRVRSIDSITFVRWIN